MFQYEYEKSHKDWSRLSAPSRASENSAVTVTGYKHRALPNPPTSSVMCQRQHIKTTVPLKVWIVASASCFAVCAALVLATVVITKWGTTDYSHNYYQDYQEESPSIEYPLSQPINTNTMKIPIKQYTIRTTTENTDTTDDQIPILAKLAIFKNLIGKRDDKNKRKKHDKETLLNKQQIHPIHDTYIIHDNKKIEKKDFAKHPDIVNGVLDDVPPFKPTLPDLSRKFQQYDIPDPIYTLRKLDPLNDNDYFYDDNLYDDYMQSNTMTSYLIEKVQELHDWINTDSDFDVANNVTSKSKTVNGFTQVLKALNESLVEGNVTIIMNKLKDIYFGENYTNVNHSRKVILSNSTDLLSFGILSLDVMLLHNIQLMAWENQESVRNKMLRDPDVFTFNAMFMDPSKVEAKYNEVITYREKPTNAKRQNHKINDDFEFGRTLIENVLEVGMNTARAAIHLGRAYKNTKQVLNQITNRETLNQNLEGLSRNKDSNTHALQHLQTFSVANKTDFYTELDCVWLLYCKNLVVTAKLNAPYGVMARINGVALRMLTGELSADKALDTMIYEALTGWKDLKCIDMFPRCSKVNPAKVVMESLLSPLRKPNVSR